MDSETKVLEFLQNKLNTQRVKEEPVFEMNFFSKKIEVYVKDRGKNTNTIGKSKNIRNEQFGAILEQINPPRLEIGLKEISAPRLAKMIKDAGIQDLGLFIGSCSDAPNFSKFFWWKIKEKTRLNKLCQ